MGIGIGGNYGRMLRGQTAAAQASRAHADALREGRSKFGDGPSRTPMSAVCVECGVAERDVHLVTCADGLRCVVCDERSESRRATRQALMLGSATAWAWGLTSAVWLGVVLLALVVAVFGVDLGIVDPPRYAYQSGPDISGVVFCGYAPLLAVASWTALTGLREIEAHPRLSLAAPELGRARWLHLLGGLLAAAVGVATWIAPVAIGVLYVLSR